VACGLAVFVPYGIAAVLLKTISGVEVSHGAIWDGCSGPGKMPCSVLSRSWPNSVSSFPMLKSSAPH
jgi:hypothetical protein